MKEDGRFGLRLYCQDYWGILQPDGDDFAGSSEPFNCVFSGETPRSVSNGHKGWQSFFLKRSKVNHD